MECTLPSCFQRLFFSIKCCSFQSDSVPIGTVTLNYYRAAEPFGLRQFSGKRIVSHNFPSHQFNNSLPDHLAA